MCLLLPLAIGTEVVSRIESNSGMIFQRHGDVVNKVGEWNIVTTFDTNILREKLRLLRKINLRVNSYFETANLSISEKSNYRNILSRDSNKIEEKLLNLAESSDVPSQHSIKKRALFCFGSSILKFIYGTPDADDAEDHNKKFREIIVNQHHQDELKKYNFKAVTDVYNFFNQTQNKTNEVINKVYKALHILKAHITFLEVQQSPLEATKAIHDLVILCQSLVTILYNEIDTLQNSILFAQEDILHPSVINIALSRSILSSIKLDSNRKWISDILSDAIHVILSHCTLETHHLPYQLLFVIKVPVIESTVYSLFLCFPFPTPLANDTYFYIQPFARYFLIDLAKSQYSYNLDNLDHCWVIINNLHHAAAQSSEFQLLHGRSDNCKFQTSAFRPSIWHQVASNQWLYTLHEEERQETSSTYSFLSWLFGGISFTTWILIGIGGYLLFRSYSMFKSLKSSTSPIDLKEFNSALRNELNNVNIAQ